MRNGSGAQTNQNDWERNLRAKHEEIRKAMRAAAPEAALVARDAVRSRIPPGASKSAGMPNVFPGYAATGRMRDSIVTMPVVERGDSISVRVGLDSGASNLDRIKFAVHEHGAVITAKNGGVLRFKVNGRWVSTKKVTIKPKRFFASGMGEATPAIEQIIKRRLAESNK